MKINTETETVVKKILPYLQRRGYDLSQDLDFETGIKIVDRYNKGYIDILVTCGKTKPLFLIEAKKISKTLTAKDRDQALSYGASTGVPFVVVTNGIDIQCFNTKTKTAILWDSKLQNKIPTKDQLAKVITTLKSNPLETCIKISNDSSLPYRPGLALRQLNALFYKCHSAIRKIEKSEESAFADFSKILFLKLLEEKNDLEEDFVLPYSYRFHELAEITDNSADQIKVAVLSMIEGIVERTPFGDVLKDKIQLKNPKTFQYIVKELAAVSFCDCSLDSKGAAFEYFVRATLKGKKLGQYFTPRELVQVMLALIGPYKIVNSVTSGTKIKILDPACGTGGFLVFIMQYALEQIKQKLKRREINVETFNTAQKLIKEKIFFGSDANEGVAASAKMNMIIAGDGHTNIQHENSLSKDAQNWNVEHPDCDLIMSNPPFGTSETGALSSEELSQYPINSAKGQNLFLQKMVLSLKPGSGELCTVIDEGILNTEQAKPLREWLLKECRLKAVINLPSETFKPNKINVKSSVLYFERRESPDLYFEDSYKITICKLDTLGYLGSGDKIRGFDFNKFFDEIHQNVLDHDLGLHRKGYGWEAFDISSNEIVSSPSYRFDFKYWNTDVRLKINELFDQYGTTIKDLNLLPTARGKSPTADSYVDESEGYAVVIKSGSNINKFGGVVIEGADWIEKSIYDEYVAQEESDSKHINTIKNGDILLSSTGDGTLGKCAIYNLDIPAVADGHITIIRVDPSVICPEYLCDYLRAGFGAVQINRLFTGSTGMIELTPIDVDTIVIDLKGGLDSQKSISDEVRSLEQKYRDVMNEAEAISLTAYDALK